MSLGWGVMQAGDILCQTPRFRCYGVYGGCGVNATHECVDHAPVCDRHLCPLCTPIKFHRTIRATHLMVLGSWIYSNDHHIYGAPYVLCLDALIEVELRLIALTFKRQTHLIRKQTRWLTQWARRIEHELQRKPRWERWIPIAGRHRHGKHVMKEVVRSGSRHFFTDDEINERDPGFDLAAVLAMESTL